MNSKFCISICRPHQPPPPPFASELSTFHPSVFLNSRRILFTQIIMIFFPSPSSYFLSQQQVRSFYGSYKRLEFAFGGRRACSLAKAAADVLLLFFISKLAALRLLPEDGAGAKKLNPPATNKVNDEGYLPHVSRGRKKGTSSYRGEKPRERTDSRNETHVLTQADCCPPRSENSSHVWLAV